MNRKCVAQPGPGLGKVQAVLFSTSLLIQADIHLCLIPGMGRTDSRVRQARTDSQPCHFLAVGLFTSVLSSVNLVSSSVYQA